VGEKSTTDVFAPAAQAGRDRNVQHFPRQHRTARRARRPQPATQLQHSDRQSKIHFRLPSIQAASAAATSVTSPAYVFVTNLIKQSAHAPQHFGEYLVLANSTMPHQRVNTVFVHNRKKSPRQKILQPAT
jgi:hypothetical protein